MRRMIVLMVAGLVLSALLFLVPRTAPCQTLPGPKIDAKILYAGNVGTARQKEFVEFLRTYFTQVDTADITKFQARDAAKCDILLIDAEAKAGGADALDVPPLTLPDTFSKPTVTIGVMGGLFCANRRLKTGYL